MLMFEPFILRAVTAGILVVFTASPIGCLMAWRRVAYFSDALSHSSLAGVVLGLALGINQSATVVLIAFVLAFVIARIKDSSVLDKELVLLMFGQIALCIGIVGLSLMPEVRSDLTAYLFGDILAVTNRDLSIIFGLSVASLFLISFSWEKQIFMALSPDLAQTQGVNLSKESLKFTFLVAFFIAIAVKTVGVLLVSGLLIIPPQCARFFSKSPEGMVLGGRLFGSLSIVLGFYVSIYWDIPPAPTCLLVAGFLFLLCLFCHICHKKDT